MSQSKLGEALDVDHSFIGRVETGHRKPSINILGRMMDYFKMGPIERLEMLRLWGFPIGLSTQTLRVLALTELVKVESIVIRRPTAQFPEIIRVGDDDAISE